MKTYGFYALLLAGSLIQARSQTADTLVVQGRQFLAARDLTNANARFAAAVGLAPFHTNANVLWAATRLLILAEQPTGRAFLDRLGIERTNRSVYGWTANIAHDTNGVPLAPVGMSAAEMTAFLRTNVLVQVMAAGTNLALAGSGNWTLDLTSNETSTAAVTLDYADVLTFRALLKAAEYFIYTTYSWNLNVQLAELRSIYTNGPFDFERLLAEHNTLLRFIPQPELNQARNAFNEAANLYIQASELIRARTNVVRLFNLDPDSTPMEAQFRTTLEDVRSSLQGLTSLRAYPGKSVFAGAQFDGVHPPRSLLPLFKGGAFALRSIDPTFGGTFFGLRQSEVDNFIAGGIPAATFITPAFSAPGILAFDLPTVPGHGYVVESSIDLVHWLGGFGFIALEDSYHFENQYAFNAREFYRVADCPWSSLPRPVNDSFALRFVLNGLSVSTPAYNVNATSEPGEPYSYWRRTVWWTWQAPASGRVVVSALAAHSSYQVNVYTGTLPFTEVDRVSEQDQFFNGFAFDAVAGTIYQIRVDGPPGAFRLVLGRPPVLTLLSPASDMDFYGSGNVQIAATASDPGGSLVSMECWADDRLLASSPSGQLNVNWTNIPLGWHYLVVSARGNLGITTSRRREIAVHPVNDLFAEATPIPTIPATLEASNEGATTESGEPYIDIMGGASIWWKWTPSTTGPVTISAAIIGRYPWSYGALFVFTGNVITQLSPLVNDFGSDLAQVTFLAIAGTTYHILFDEEWGNPAQVQLQLLPTLAPTVSFITPTNNQHFYGPANVPISLAASDIDGTVSSVRIVLPYESPSTIAVLTNAPWNFEWTNVSPGYRTITAEATDNQGARSWAVPVSIYIQPSPLPNASSGKRAAVQGR